jgi:hypothetical protein
MRHLLTVLCAPEGAVKLKQLANKLPSPTSSRLMNLVYTKNVVLSDGDQVVRKVYNIKKLSEMSHLSPQANLTHSTS